MNCFVATYGRVLMLFVLAVFFCELNGCGPAAPKTYPVNGKITFKGKSGTFSRLVGGKVWFQSISDSNAMAIGVIDEDGSFSMNMYIPNEKKGYQGVIAGQYKARIETAPDEDRKAPRPAIEPKFEDFDKSGLKFTVPDDGSYLIEVVRFR